MFKYSWVLLLVYLSLFWTCRGHVCGTVLGFFLERVAQKQTCFAVPPRKLCGWISNEERYWTKDTLVNHLRALKDSESNRPLFDFVGFHNYHSFVYFNFALKRKWCNKKVIISGGVLRLASCWLWHVSEFRLTLEGIFSLESKAALLCINWRGQNRQVSSFFQNEFFGVNWYTASYCFCDGYF